MTSLISDPANGSSAWHAVPGDDHANAGTSSVLAPVVVYVDGSPAARAATAWAVTEARDRGVPLRLVSVIDDEPHMCRAEDALRLARGAVESQALTVQVDEVIRHGPRLDVLLQESSGAAMICLGSSHRNGTALDVATTTLAQQAHCNVAIIRAEDNGDSWSGGTVTVVLDDEPGNDTIVHQAMREGRLRHATVRQVDRRLKSWVRRFPDVHVEVVAAGAGWNARQSSDRSLAQLAVIGHADAERLAGLVSPNCHSILGYPDLSMLFVNDESSEDSPPPTAATVPNTTGSSQSPNTRGPNNYVAPE